MADMTLKKAAKVAKRYCKVNSSTFCDEHCLLYNIGGCGLENVDDETEQILTDWDKEHPAKTRGDIIKLLIDSLHNDGGLTSCWSFCWSLLLSVS